MSFLFLLSEKNPLFFTFCLPKNFKKASPPNNWQLKWNFFSGRNEFASVFKKEPRLFSLFSFEKEKPGVEEENGEKVSATQKLRTVFHSFRISIFPSTVPNSILSPPPLISPVARISRFQSDFSVRSIFSGKSDLMDKSRSR